MSSTTNTLSSALNLDISTIFRERNRSKSMNKRWIKSFVFRLSASFDFSFSVEEKQV